MTSYDEPSIQVGNVLATTCDTLHPLTACEHRPPARYRVLDSLPYPSLAPASVGYNRHIDFWCRSRSVERYGGNLARGEFAENILPLYMLFNSVKGTAPPWHGYILLWT